VTDEDLCAAVIALYDADSRCEETPGERRAAIGYQLHARCPTNAAAKPFVTRLVREYLLSDEAVAAGRSADDVGPFMGWIEPARYPENFPIEQYAPATTLDPKENES
jgi:hypothetical protein